MASAAVMHCQVSTTAMMTQAQQKVEAEEDEEYEEFDPYAFIAQLPPLPEEERKRVPVIPPRPRGSYKPTLVLDLDETLVHCSTEPLDCADITFPVLFGGILYQVYVRKRPFLAQFLHAVAQIFEVVVFTASQKVYADKLLNILDPHHKYITHRLYRDSCTNIEGNYIKNLLCLGRDLQHTVIVDNSPQVFGYQLDNGIPIESWYDDPNDMELSRLLPFLKTLVNAPDVRPLVRNKFKLHQRVESFGF